MCGPALLPHHRDHRARLELIMLQIAQIVLLDLVCREYTWNVVENSPPCARAGRRALVWVLLRRVYTRFRVRE